MTEIINKRALRRSARFEVGEESRLLARADAGCPIREFEVAITPDGAIGVFNAIYLPAFAWEGRVEFIASPVSGALSIALTTLVRQTAGSSQPAADDIGVVRRRVAFTAFGTGIYGYALAFVGVAGVATNDVVNNAVAVVVYAVAGLLFRDTAFGSVRFAGCNALVADAPRDAVVAGRAINGIAERWTAVGIFITLGGFRNALTWEGGVEFFT